VTHVVMFSGGIGSWAAATRVAARHGTADLVLLFTDTKIEDPDLYRFLHEAAAHVGGRLVQIADGRTPWEVFRDVKFLGNSRVDPCSRILKREIADKWLIDHCNPADTTVYVGIDWSEEHRFTRLAARKAERGWHYEAPLCEPPYILKPQMFELLAAAGIRRPRLYDFGMQHNNCGGGCVKAGVGHFARLLRVLPDVYAEWERQEDTLRGQLGEVSILRDRTGGTSTPLSLQAFRERIEAGHQPDLWDIGGCGCFLDEPEAA
jgi:hypothetical protein